MKKSALWWMILLITLTTIHSYPSKPLNERSTELNWQAWLLIDQNNRQTDLNMLRRRITPKSVFIAPTFSPDTLPACAEGYRSDSMGRCVKIIRIDEAAHLNFLLQRLNEQFADYDDDNDEPSSVTAAPTPGPYQLNIPLFNNYNNNNNDYDNETDMAIILAPTKSTSLKLDVKKTDNNKFNANNIAAMLGVKPEDLETTTIADFVTSTTTTTDFTTITTTLSGGDDEETTATTLTTNPPETTTEPIIETTTTSSATTTTTTTTTEGEALFFRWRF